MIRYCEGTFNTNSIGVAGNETYHRFLWDDPSADPCGGICANCVRGDLPRLFPLRKPSDVSVAPVTRIRPVLVAVGGVSRVVIVLAADIGYCRDGLLKLCTLVRVDLGVRGVVNGRGVFVELVLVVEGGNLERL